jgi:hypothetical protein
MSENKKTIRNINADVMREARIYAIQTDRTLGELVTESLVFFMAEADDPAWQFTDEAA